MKLVFCGPDTDRKARCEDIARAEGLDVPADINLGFANFGRQPIEELTWADVSRRVKDAESLISNGANRLLIDWEPEGVSWSGRSRALSDDYADVFRHMLAACWNRCPDVGVYGFPASKIAFPHITETAKQATDAIGAGMATAFYPSLYFYQLASDEITYEAGGLEAEWHTTRLASTIQAARKVAGERPVRPCFQGHIELKGRPQHGTRLGKREVTLWFATMTALGISEAVWWMDNENDLEDQIRRYAPWIINATRAA